jgi:hypothetical protein
VNEERNKENKYTGYVEFISQYDFNSKQAGSAAASSTSTKKKDAKAEPKKPV